MGPWSYTIFGLAQQALKVFCLYPQYSEKEIPATLPHLLSSIVVPEL
jgi:hypothetical protein